MWSKRILTGFFLAATALAAHAFERSFPNNATRGSMSPAGHPEIIIDGKLRRLSPGARLWNQDNLMELPPTLRNGVYVVNYTVDDRGEINKVWILTPDEAAKAPPVPQQNRAD